MALLTNESNNNHTPYEARKVVIISFDLSGLHSTGLEQESYAVHDIIHHHKRPRAKACRLVAQRAIPRHLGLNPPSPNY